MFSDLIEQRQEKLFFYSPYNFIRTEDKDKLLQPVLNKIEKNIERNEFWECEIDQEKYVFIYDLLEWDTNFFGLKTYKLFTVLFNQNSKNTSNAIDKFKEFLESQNASYLFIELPSEDIKLIQCLGENSFKLVETRLNYYNDNIQRFDHPTRYGIRRAEENDINNLSRVAALMRNEFDRFHADSIFDLKIADSFLSKYVEEAIRGFCDVVIVPNEANSPADSFLTANFCKNDWLFFTQARPSKMVLSAVSAETNKGWYVKLISEMAYLFKQEGSTHAMLNTQSTNRQVFHTWEKLGFKLGYSTHVFSLTF